MITKEQLAEYAALDSKAAILEREAKTYRDRQKQLEEKFEEDLKESKKPSVIRHGYTFAWVNGAASVKWAEEFLRECGVEKANALKASAAMASIAAKMKILPPAAPPDTTPAAAAAEEVHPAKCILIAPKKAA
jgi:hypothetical protein